MPGACERCALTGVPADRVRLLGRSAGAGARRLHASPGLVGLARGGSHKRSGRLMSPPALTGTLPGEFRAEADMQFRPVHTSIWKAVTMHGHRIAVFGLVRVFRVALGLSLVSEAAERPTAFRGIRWGTSIRAIPGLQVDPSPPHAAQDV